MIIKEKGSIMIYNYCSFNNSLLIRNFTKSDARDYSLIEESPIGVHALRATLSDDRLDELKRKYVDFIFGLTDEYDKYVVQLVMYDDTTGNTKVYGLDYPFEDCDERITAQLAYDTYYGLVDRFKLKLITDSDKSIFERAEELAYQQNLDLIAEY